MLRMSLAAANESLADLPEAVRRGLEAFITEAKTALGPDLASVVLYGSGAEGRLRPTSDVNILLVLTEFDASKAATLLAPFAAAQAAIRLTAMFLLTSEVAAAMESFGQKFSDVVRRHRVILGPDPFAGVQVPRPAVILRTKQVLLNLILRLRESYVARGSTPERISALIADAAGPLRSCAATLLELEGKPTQHPKEALSSFVAAFNESGWEQALAHFRRRGSGVFSRRVTPMKPCFASSSWRAGFELGRTNWSRHVALRPPRARISSVLRDLRNLCTGGALRLAPFSASRMIPAGSISPILI